MQILECKMIFEQNFSLHYRKITVLWWYCMIHAREFPTMNFPFTRQTRAHKQLSTPQNKKSAKISSFTVGKVHIYKYAHLPPHVTKAP